MTSSPTGPGLAARLPGRLVPDPSRVITRLFAPGHALPGVREGRASEMVGHVLALSDDEVSAALDSVMQRFAGRHRDLTEAFRTHADQIVQRLDVDVDVSGDRWLLLGATFTHEYSVEAAALCNPSAVAHPDQSGVPDGSLRFVMSVRQIGEGHRSSVGFRTGLVDQHGTVALDDLSGYTVAGAIGTSALDAEAFGNLTEQLRDGTETTSWVLDRIGEHLTSQEFEARLTKLESQYDNRPNVGEVVRRLRNVATRTYIARFGAESELSERVLYPATTIEANGVEDARFVRFVDDDGTVTYFATYTAFDGFAINQQLLETTDFTTFEMSPLLGPAAANKGMAIFPRRIGGHFAALSRFDGAKNSIAFSDNIRQWQTATTYEWPTAAWEVVQIGNCGPPIETDEGWLVLTHGVGPMRTYSIGACLLDLDDPTKLIGRTRTPVLTPLEDEQDGYVPNVVYSCGALLHAETLMIPFGIGDAAISFATIALSDLLDAMGD